MKWNFLIWKDMVHINHYHETVIYHKTEKSLFLFLYLISVLKSQCFKIPGLLCSVLDIYIISHNNRVLHHVFLLWCSKTQGVGFSIGLVFGFTAVSALYTQCVYIYFLAIHHITDKYVLSYYVLSNCGNHTSMVTMLCLVNSCHIGTNMLTVKLQQLVLKFTNLD